MKKILISIPFLATILSAQTATQDELNSIYTEAILFVAVFGIMGIISYIYSSKHAKAYVPKKVVTKLTPYQEACKTRVQELSKMLEEKSITEDEFEVLEKYYKI